MGNSTAVSSLTLQVFLLRQKWVMFLSLHQKTFLVYWRISDVDQMPHDTGNSSLNCLGKLLTSNRPCATAALWYHKRLLTGKLCAKLVWGKKKDLSCPYDQGAGDKQPYSCTLVKKQGLSFSRCLRSGQTGKTRWAKVACSPLWFTQQQNNHCSGQTHIKRTYWKLLLI